MILKLQRNIAFTLAEVLITLGIIGIVAAMTLPVISAHYRKKRNIRAFTKIFINNAKCI